MTTVRTGIPEHRIRNSMLTLVLFCMLLFAAQGMFAHQAQATRIHGYLKNDAGEPIAGVRVTASTFYEDDGATYFDEEAYAYSDESGYYDFEYDMLENIAVTFHTSDLNYVSGYYCEDSTPTRVFENAKIINDQTGNADYDLGDICLKQGSIIRGIVKDSAGKPLSDIFVSLLSSGGDNGLDYNYGWTGSDGAYEILGVAPDNYRVLFDDNAEVYLPQFNGGVFTYKEATGIEVEAQSTTTVNATMKMGGVIKGTVKDTDGAPIDDVEVGVRNSTEIEWEKWAVSATGDYTVTGLIDGGYFVGFYANDYDTQYYDGVDDPSKATLVPIKNASTATNINAQLSKRGTISGVVKDEFGNALPDVSVILYDMGDEGDSAHSVQSDSAGRFALKGLTAGDYKIGFLDRSQNKYCLAYYCATASGKATTEFSGGDTVVLERGANLTLNDVTLSQKKGTITGKVTNTNGESLEGIEVSLYSVDGNGDSGHSVTTDAFGNYALDNVAPGQYKVGFHDFYHRDYASSYYNGANTLDEASVVTVTPGNVCSGIDGQLMGRCAISGRVVDTYGNPIEGICVSYEPEHYDSGVSDHWVLTDANGMYTIRHVNSGETKVSFSDWVAEGNPGVYTRPEGYYGRQYSSGKYSEDVADSFTLSPGDNKTNVDATMTRRHSVSGVLSNPDGTPAVGVKVLLEEEWGDYSVQNAVTDSHGMYTFNNLDNVSYYLEAGSYDSGEWYRWFNMEGADLTIDGVIANEGGSFTIGDSFEKTFWPSPYKVTARANSDVAREIDSLGIWFASWQDDQGKGLLELGLYPRVKVADGRLHDCFNLKSGYIETDIELPQGINALDGTLDIAAEKASYDSSGLNPMEKCAVGSPLGAYSYAVLNEAGTKIRVYAKSAGWVLICAKQSSGGGSTDPNVPGETYTVNFDSCGGSALASKEASSGALVVAPVAPTRTGYTFDGWYKEATCSNAWNFSADKITQDTTLYAKWTIKSFTASFNTQGGSSVDSQSVDYGTVVTSPAAPTRTGYTFAGWYKEAACSNAWDFSTDKITQDTTLYAKWTIKSFTASFNTQGGSSIGNQSVDYGTVATRPADPTRSGYAFDGWYKEATCSNAWNFSTDKITQNTTLYAKWKGNTYSLAFNLNGGASLEETPTVYTFGTEFVLPQAQKTQYTFKGWFDNEALTGSALTSVGISNPGNKTLYAKWEAVSSGGTGGTGGTGGSGGGTGGGTGGGATDPGTGGGGTGGGTTGPVTPAKTYTVSFELNSGSGVTSQQVAAGAHIATPADPTRSGYVFAGWYADAALTQAWNFSVQSVSAPTTLYAKWNALSSSNTISSVPKTTGTWVKRWTSSRTSNTLILSRSKSSVKLAPRISSKAKLYFKYAGKSYARIGSSKTVKVARGKSKTVYFKVVAQNGKAKTYKIVVKRKR